MDLTFQVPMQYHSLQHWTLLPSPVKSITGCCFCFGSVSSFFLELFLHQSPVAYWAPTNLGSSSFSVLSFCLFILLMGFSRQDYWSGYPCLWMSNSVPWNKTSKSKKKKKKGGKLFKYPNCSWCIFIICLYLSLPLPVTFLVEGILVQIICFIYIFHLHVVNCKLFSLFFVTCRLKNNKYPLSPSYIIKIQLLKLHIIN